MDFGVRHTPRHQTGLPTQNRTVVPVVVCARCRYPFAGASARLGVQTALASRRQERLYGEQSRYDPQAVLRLCERQGYYDNIAAGIRSSKRHTEYSKLSLTAEQAFRLLDSIDATTVIGRRDRLMISLMLFNGLRTCEVERIDIGDFAEREGRQILYIQRKGRTDKNEFVVLHPNTVEWLEEYIADRNFDEWTPLVISHKAKCDNRLVRQTIGRVIKQHLARIGISHPKISAHSLRHTFGALMVEQGVDIETIKDMMGHSDTKTTRIYIEMAQQRRLLHHSPAKEVAEAILRNGDKPQ